MRACVPVSSCPSLGRPSGSGSPFRAHSLSLGAAPPSMRPNFLGKIGFWKKSPILFRREIFLRGSKGGEFCVCFVFSMKGGNEGFSTVANTPRRSPGAPAGCSVGCGNNPVPRAPPVTWIFHSILPIHTSTSAPRELAFIVFSQRNRFTRVRQACLAAFGGAQTRGRLDHRGRLIED